MHIGAATLSRRGSGSARLALIAEPIPGVDRIVAAGRQLSESLVARSSSPLEGASLWAGAFASYVDITPDELPKAVVGCWASAFTVDAMARQSAAGTKPGTTAMAVLVQPAITPRCGGVAGIEPDGAMTVEAVAGSPMPLLQGWERGFTVRRLAGGRWAGDQALALVGEEALDELGSVLEVAAARFGVNRCEWGLADRVWLLQLGTEPPAVPSINRTRETTPAELVPVVQAMVAGSVVFGTDPISPSVRVGARPWEPLVASVVLDHGTVSQGTPAAAGIGAGMRRHLANGGQGRTAHRAVVTADRPLPQLSQHLWDAAGLVTGAGSPAAHLFEAARSLRVPAVSGVDLAGDGDLIVAVDGYSGLVATLPLDSEG